MQYFSSLAAQTLQHSPSACELARKLSTEPWVRPSAPLCIYVVLSFDRQIQRLRIIINYHNKMVHFGILSSRRF